MFTMSTKAGPIISEHLGKTRQWQAGGQAETHQPRFVDALSTEKHAWVQFEKGAKAFGQPNSTAHLNFSRLPNISKFIGSKGTSLLSCLCFHTKSQPPGLSSCAFFIQSTWCPLMKKRQQGQGRPKQLHTAQPKVCTSLLTSILKNTAEWLKTKRIPLEGRSPSVRHPPMVSQA